MFVVLEGGEGSGKSTQAERLAAWLREQGREVVLTFEPGDTKMGAQMREMLLHGDAPLGAPAELLLMLADRAQHVEEVIRPALARGAVVVCDRYTPSTLAYQGVGRGLGVEVIDRLNEVATQGVEPDVVIVLDVSEEVAAARIPGHQDRLERAGAEFHTRVRAAYRDLAEARGWIIVDGTGTIDEVAARIEPLV